MAFPMFNSYEISNKSVADRLTSPANIGLGGTGLFVRFILAEEIENEGDYNKLKSPVIRFIPYNTEREEYYPYFIDITNAPCIISEDDGAMFYAYTLCQSDDIAGDETYYFKRPHYQYGTYAIFNPYDHTNYIVIAFGTEANISNEMLHKCEPWRVPDLDNEGGGGMN